MIALILMGCGPGGLFSPPDDTGGGDIDTSDFEVTLVVTLPDGAPAGTVELTEGDSHEYDCETDSSCEYVFDYVPGRFNVNFEAAEPAEDNWGFLALEMDLTEEYNGETVEVTWGEWQYGLMPEDDYYDSEDEEREYEVSTNWDLIDDEKLVITGVPGQPEKIVKGNTYSGSDEYFIVEGVIAEDLSTITYAITELDGDVREGTLIRQ